MRIFTSLSIENIRILMNAQHELRFRCFNSRDEIYLVFTKKWNFNRLRATSQSLKKELGAENTKKPKYFSKPK